MSPTVAAPAAFGRLFRESCIRGLHAFGLAQPGRTEPFVTRAFDREVVVSTFDTRRPAVAHARYSTSGDWQTPENNQPVVAAGMALAMNGVLSMATKPEFETAFGVRCASDNDAEIFLRLIERGADPAHVLGTLTGSFAGVWLDGATLYAGRNARRPLWRCDAYGAIWYASTADILRRAGFPAGAALQPGLVWSHV